MPPRPSIALSLGRYRRPPPPRPALHPLDRRRAISAYGYAQAKCLVYSAPGEPRDVLALHSHSISPPHGDLLTLRTLAAPLNPADVNAIQGTYPTAPPFTRELGTPAPAAVPGSEGVWAVVQAGAAAAAAGFRPGDWVLPRRPGLGTWRTHAQLPAAAVQRIPREGLDARDAARVAVNPLTARLLLEDYAPLREGDWYVQNGANSAVGRAALQLGRARGLRCIAIVRARPTAEAQDALAQELRGLGATHVATEQELLGRGFGERVAEWTRGRRDPLRLALNCVGGRPGTALARLLAPGGVHVTYGAMARQPLAVAAGLLIFRDVRFVGCWVSRLAEMRPEVRERYIEELLEMVRRGGLILGPREDVQWKRSTGLEELVGAVQGTLEGYRSGKGVFVFEDS